MKFSIALALFASWTSVLEAQQAFVDVRQAVGLNYIHEVDHGCPNPPIGSGSAWADYDNDVDVDLYVSSMGGTSHLFQNQGDTNGDSYPDFLDVALQAGVGIADLTAGVVFADYDNDGDQDLYVARWGGNLLFQNQLIESGSATFLDVTTFAAVADSGRAITAAWGDYDQDGWLDLFLAKHVLCMPDNFATRDVLFRNNQDGTFENVSQFLCEDGTLDCDQLNVSRAFTAAWFDYDNDSDPDLYLANDVVAMGYPNILWRNDGPDGAGGWVFTDVSEESGTDYSINCKGLGIGDYNNDGWFDVAMGHSEGGFLMKNLGDGTFEEAAFDAGVHAPWTPLGDNAVVWATPFADFDNDQWLDLVHIRGMISSTLIEQPDALFRNNHDGTFTDISQGSGMDDPRRGRSASICDFNRDGFVDMFVGNFGDSAGLVLNQFYTLGTENNWLVVTGEGFGTVNRDAIGARFFLTTPDGVTQIREISSGPPHGGGDFKAAYFGMGENLTGELTVRWPDGVTQDLGEVTANQHLRFSNLPQSVTSGEPIPSRSELFQNYPNPFNPKTEIRMQVVESGHVTLTISDLLGRQIAVLVDERKTPGSHSVQWDASAFPSGVYFYTMGVQGEQSHFTETRRLVLLR